MKTPLMVSPPLTGTDHGRACAVAAQGQRDLRRHMARYADLFPGGQFDPALVGMLTLNFACCAPNLSASQLRLINRVGLWIFCADSALEACAGSPAELARRCLTVADGSEREQGDSLLSFLAEIRDELAAKDAFAGLRPVWLDQLRRMLDAMVREWEWATAAKPTYEEYLPVAAASIGLPFTYLSHWIATDHGELGDVSDVIVATMAAEPLLRLINDLGSYERDRAHGDVNALLLDVSADEVRRQVDVERARLDDVLGPLRNTTTAVFIERQVGFNLGLYEVGDYRPEGAA